MHFSSSLLATTALVFNLASAAPTSTSGVNTTDTALIASLLQAPTSSDRANLLTPPDYVYDFLNPPLKAITKGKGGHTVKSDLKTFPGLIGSGVAMTVGFLGPCGFNTPHTHLRSSEIVIAVQGRLGTAFTIENGVKSVDNVLETYQMTVFQQGAVHTSWNPDCEDAVFVAGFGNEDPGVQQSAQTLFGLQEEVVLATLGVEAINGESVEVFKKLIPANVALGVESCLKKCGIAKRKL